MGTTVWQFHDLVVEPPVFRMAGVLMGDASHLDGSMAPLENLVAVELSGDLVVILALWVVVDDPALLV